MNTNSYDPKPSEQMIPPFRGRPGEHTGPVIYGTLREIWSAEYLASLGIYPDSHVRPPRGILGHWPSQTVIE
jgi:hypothetical protein